MRTQTAFVLTLVLSCVSAYYRTTNFFKDPMIVADDNETKFSKTGSNITPLTLFGSNSGDLYLLSTNKTSESYPDRTTTHLNAYLKSIDPNNFRIGGNISTLEYVGPDPHPDFFRDCNTDPDLIAHGYIITFRTDNETGIPAVRVYQQSLDGGTTVGRFRIDSNTNATFHPRAVSCAYIGKTLYVFYVAAANKVNFTSFTIGTSIDESVGTIKYTVTTTYYHNSIFRCVWNEALGNSQIMAAWEENDYDRILKYGVLNVTSGILTTNTIENARYREAYACRPYSTHENRYGEFCVFTSKNASYNIDTYFSFGDGSLIYLSSYNDSGHFLEDIQPYGPYLVLFFSVDGHYYHQTKSYEIWDLDTRTIVKGRIPYVTGDLYKVQRVAFRDRGIYALLYGFGSWDTLQNIAVGQIIDRYYSEQSRLEIEGL